jgi:hypothetical protein
MRRFGAGLILGAFLGLSCGGPVDEPTGTGHLEASWTGSDSGRLSAPATAEWCSERRLLEIRAMRGDTGFAMVLYPLDTVEADTYRVVPPEGADSLAPSAALALRLFSPSAMKGYQGDSGKVVLQRSRSGELSGIVEARSRPVLRTEPISISGKFSDLVVTPQTRGCVAEPPADSVPASDFDDDDSELSDTDVD